MIELAKQLMSSNNWVILDTETTGLDYQAEAVQIGVLAPDGTVLLDTLVKPRGLIPHGASEIHGIYNRHVANSPAFMELLPELRRLLAGKNLVIYNAPYDKRILQQSFEAHFPGEFVSDLFGRGGILETCRFTDVMQPYAEYWGAWSDYHQSYTWQKLSVACRQQGIEIVDAHSAIGDCKMTLALLRRLAEK